MIDALLHTPTHGDPHRLLSNGAPVDYHGRAGWVSWTDKYRLRATFTEDSEPVDLWFPRDSGHGLKLRLVWKGEIVPEGLDRACRGMAQEHRDRLEEQIRYVLTTPNPDIFAAICRTIGGNVAAVEGS